MRELSINEIRSVNGGNPLLGGIGGAVLGGVQAYGAGGNVGDITIAATFGFATGTYGAIAWAAKSVYYGAVAVGMAFMAGMAVADDS
ncbi:MAG: hypothetical protein Q7L07_09315 [Pseudohongiella sp.]|jgi:hypothetical protein|nr:hypothetical protein [Pseudohongiella sp.]MDP1756242.1 hypothetical protein [Pseudohongiella sp.]MDP2282978.1 hypothetical protein [Pseudohongiella sp.]